MWGGEGGDKMCGGGVREVCGEGRGEVGEMGLSEDASVCCTWFLTLLVGW